MKLQTEHGASAVEFALTLPLLLILMFGIIEFSVLLFDKAVVTNASREGARFGVVYATDGENYTPMTDEDIKTAVKNYANDYLINLGGTTRQLADGDIVITPGTRESGDDLSVVVNFTYDFLVFPDLTEVLGGSFDGTKTVIGQTIMRME